MARPSSLTQYLQTYAEPEAGLLSQFAGLSQLDNNHPHYQYVLCIPAYKEPLALLDRLKAISASAKLLIILVVNAPDTANEAELKICQDLLSHINTTHPVKNIFSRDIRLHPLTATVDLLLVDRCQDDNLLSVKEGVGLARKIAADIACQLIQQHIIASPWICCTDADTVLPKEYFCVLDTIKPEHYCAVIYPFQHSVEPSLQLVQLLYDISLHYYVAGLKWAGSPYAFHTIGSTLCVSHKHYAKVRGFPKRAAAEDFYLLNKLQKTGPVLNLEAPLLTIDSRLSDRVPFGTGPALQNLQHLQKPLEEYLYYDPNCFVYLRAWLNSLPALFELGKDELSVVEMAQQGVKCNKGLEPGVLSEVLAALGAEKAHQHAFKQGKNTVQYLKQMHDWFDGFRTLKFIHFLRDNFIPSRNLLTVLPAAELLVQNHPPLRQTIDRLHTLKAT